MGTIDLDDKSMQYKRLLSKGESVDLNDREDANFDLLSAKARGNRASPQDGTAPSSVAGLAIAGSDDLELEELYSQETKKQQLSAILQQ